MAVGDVLDVEADVAGLGASHDEAVLPAWAEQEHAPLLLGGAGLQNGTRFEQEGMPEVRREGLIAEGFESLYEVLELHAPPPPTPVK